MSAEAEAEARAVADAQLIAYNARDMEAYLALFHEDATLINLPSQEVVASGIDQIRKMYETRFATPGLKCVVHDRSEIGDIAIDREAVYTDSHPPVDIMAMYQVEQKRIKRVFFIRGGTL